MIDIIKTFLHVICNGQAAKPVRLIHYYINNLTKNQNNDEKRKKDAMSFSEERESAELKRLMEVLRQAGVVEKCSNFTFVYVASGGQHVEIYVE